MVQEVAFVYTIIFRNDDDLDLEITKIFKGAKEISMKSRRFADYSECVNSCKAMLDTLTIDLMEKSGKTFVIGIELNPKYSGKDTISTNWLLGEFAKLWVYEKDSVVDHTIQAVGQACIFNIDANLETDNVDLD